AAPELCAWLGALAKTVSVCRWGPNLFDVVARVMKRVDAVGSLEQRVRARADFAQALGSINQFEEAYAALAQLFELAGERDDLRAPGLAIETEMATRSGDFTRAKRAVESLARLGPIHDSAVLLHFAHASAGAGEIAVAMNAIEQAAA